ncbi:hypothetical protein LB521_27670 [Mesorhizobium sp. BR-1-1-8]|uniref:hypothetical protein n=1 Tax=Mesorhizobium sp. BR-1-1-8 TaxID=2876659 RepID=UPI001CCE4FD1|nr:hypothetical protein [Mesorhizobium sp. BR-1-1-8]MBZ9984916.1 hypothetical protein [Mesorhizobium sp. BR-1-1-8]
MKLLDTLTGGYASLIAYGLAALAVTAILAWTYHAGAAHTAAIWQLKYDQREVAITAATNAEISRQAQANAQAKAAEAKRLDELEAANKALEAHIKELSDEANADPDRDRVCLSDASGLRIDSVH